MLKRLTPAQRNYLILKISRHMANNPEFKKKVLEKYKDKMKERQGSSKK